MNRGQHRSKQNIFFAAGLTFLALSEWLLALSRAHSVNDAIGSVSIACLFIAIPGAIIAFAMVLNHFAMAKGYGDGWTLVAILITAFALCEYGYHVPSHIPTIFGDWLFIGFWQAMPLLCFGIGSLPIWLLPDRVSRLK